MLFCLCLPWHLWMSVHLVLSLSYLVLLICDVFTFQALRKALSASGPVPIIIRCIGCSVAVCKDV